MAIRIGSPASAAYLRLGRLAQWAGLAQEQHVTPHEFAGLLGRALPEQLPAVERIVGAYVAERYRPDHWPGAEAAQALDQDVRVLRKPLLARIFSRIGAAARRPEPKVRFRR